MIARDFDYSYAKVAGVCDTTFVELDLRAVFVVPQKACWTTHVY